MRVLDRAAFEKAGETFVAVSPVCLALRRRTFSFVQELLGGWCERFRVYAETERREALFPKRASLRFRLSCSLVQTPQPLFLWSQGAKKKLSKKKRRREISRSAERDKDCASLTAPPLKRRAKLLWRSRHFILRHGGASFFFCSKSF